MRYRITSSLCYNSDKQIQDEERMMARANLFAEALSTTEAARRYHVSQRYITFLARKGAIAAKKLGRDWLIDNASLSAYLSTPHKPGPKPKTKEQPTP